VLPATHAFLIERALAGVDHAGLRARAALLQAGCVDEDLVRLPLVGWRVQSPGLSHTYRPGRQRGELGAPSALARVERLVADATATWPRDADRAAHHVGRACHLLGDVAVPARTRGVWHPLGDPYERWVDEHLGLLAQEPAAPPVSAPSIAALVDGLARLASVQLADTTRSPWGALARRLGRPRTIVDDALAERQARALVPAALAHHTAFLRLVAATLR
jgi:hypothetical protein